MSISKFYNRPWSLTNESNQNDRACIGRSATCLDAECVQQARRRAVDDPARGSVVDNPLSTFYAGADPTCNHAGAEPASAPAVRHRIADHAAAGYAPGTVSSSREPGSRKVGARVVGDI